MIETIRRLGLYGGSFDPVHNGHLILAREAFERLGLDKVLFIPAGISPHKRHRPPASAHDRLALLRASVEGEPGFAVEDCELRKDGVSYAIETVREMGEKYPEAELFFFIGEDNLAELHTWKDIEDLRELVQFVVLSRTSARPHDEFPVIDRQIDISSTDIRSRVSKGLSVQYLIPEAACSIIEQRHLYQKKDTNGR